MPTAKRLKSNGDSKSQAKKQDTARPTAADIEGESEFAQLAKQHWLKSKKRATRVKVKNDVLKREIWDALEKDGFQYKSLLVLEGLQILESYLWPGYSEEASNFHVLLIVLVTNVKARERLETWNLFEDRPADFSILFRRILAMTLDNTLSTTIRSHLLSFVIYAFQSLDCAIVRKECAPLVSISTWHNLSTETKREAKLAEVAPLKKAWKAAGRRYDAADDETKARLRFERQWLYTLTLHFLNMLYDDKVKSDEVTYIARYIEFLTDLQSSLPTRRYVHTLLQDLHLLTAIKLSPVFRAEENAALRRQWVLLRHYNDFGIDDQTGIQHSRSEAYERHCDALKKLQHVAFRHFKDKLTVLALSNYASIDKYDELKALLQVLDDEEIVNMAAHLDLRTEYPISSKIVLDGAFLLEAIVATFERSKSFQDSLPSVLPTERDLLDALLLSTEDYDGSRPLPLPKLNLQYLSVGDFLFRALVLYRAEAFHGIRNDIDAALRRLKPEIGRSGETRFAGFSKMALPTSRPSILEVVPALVGDKKPSAVRAEVSLDVRRLSDQIRREWDSLRPDDVVFLVSVDASLQQAVTNGEFTPLSEAEKLGLVSVRSAEVVSILDDKGRSIRDPTAHANGGSRAPSRRIQLKLDAEAYQKDMDLVSLGKPDVYEKVNLIIRRSGRENNFKPVLESIRSLVRSEVPLAPWLHEVFLGYGDPAAATYKSLPNRVKKIDFRDTFLNWQHLVESMPGKAVEPGFNVTGSFPPPYVLESVDKEAETPKSKPSKKRRRDLEPALLDEIETYHVSSYKPPNTGPYPTDAPKWNTVRFTAAQVDAIISGTQPGLTVIVGPPGTGKTDVATQIISNIYHNFPEQRTLLIAHSNQALNQLFAKIAALDIDERHLLRLGHGEEELDLEANFSKHGRVESFMENRNGYLQEVNRLAASIGAPGAHGNSAETAGYFDSVYVQTAWAKFTEATASEDVSAADVIQAFPFHQYFSNTPQPLFPADADRAAVLDIVSGCRHHISKIFSELKDVQPFEILKKEKDKANYLLTNEARIIAMTSTHAAMRRGEIASLGFHYDNVVMEEAAQITEIENFIPLAMQKPKDGTTALQRVVLCGDHYQNSPVVQNFAFRHFANLEQSLFSRLIRLGIPAITLDQQGRARPSIAALYQWRYPKLGNLPHVESLTEFQTANAGFKYDYQFINVPEYKGCGEMEPTPHFIQNLGEAEYAVAIFQYMRLLGYPAEKISILTTYAGQRALVKDVLGHRCAKNPIFGLPKIVTTVDKYQGEQNDYIILSLTRTSRVGYLRDIRRLTVALSRARLGLYILGRRDVFEACYELKPAFELLLQRPDKLTLVTGELWPAERLQASEGDESVPGEAVMEGVEHLGQYVFEMTNAKIKQLRQERGLPDTQVVEVLEPVNEEENAYDDGVGAAEEDAEDAEVEAKEGFEAEEVHDEQ
ncbi:intron-binding protein aquarius [Pestalotiopsis sp. NC0098]|nr:intron-binding protein aquarius [Pestalotiopsis sp. NC0098]